MLQGQWTVSHHLPKSRVSNPHLSHKRGEQSGSKTLGYRRLSVIVNIFLIFLKAVSKGICQNCTWKKFFRTWPLWEILIHCHMLLTDLYQSKKERTKLINIYDLYFILRVEITNTKHRAFARWQWNSILILF